MIDAGYRPLINALLSAPPKSSKIFVATLVEIIMEYSWMDGLIKIILGWTTSINQPLTNTWILIKFINYIITMPFYNRYLSSLFWVSIHIYVYVFLKIHFVSLCSGHQISAVTVQSCAWRWFRINISNKKFLAYLPWISVKGSVWLFMRM